MFDQLMDHYGYANRPQSIIDQEDAELAAKWYQYIEDMRKYQDRQASAPQPSPAVPNMDEMYAGLYSIPDAPPQQPEVAGNGLEGLFGMSPEAIQGLLQSGRGGSGGREQQGRAAAQAPDMSNYASVAGIRNMTAPVHPQLRPQEQYQGVPGYANEYLMSLMGG